MSTKTSFPERSSARDRLLAAAAELFYEEGITSVGIDRVIERAGVAKASLYAHFKSKDELIRAYLGQRSDARRARIEARLAKADGPREQILSVFDALGEVFSQPNYRGCAFLRASSESRADGGAAGACEDYRKYTRDLFAGLAQQAGAAEPAELTDRLMLLYDGASVSAQMDRRPAAAATARAMAELMLAAACPTSEI